MCIRDSPLTSLSREIAARKPDNLALLDDQGVPSEMRPIVSALNGLLQRMADTLENEREFTDNAAHESVSYTHLDVYKRQG